MTQPAKASEPSMEEILASIRRIIADDDTNKPPQQGPEAAKPAGSDVASELPPAAAVAPARVLPEPSPIAEMATRPAMESVEADEQPAEILELTESMTVPAPRAAPEGMPQFRTIEGNSDVSFDEDAEKPAPQAVREPPPPLISRETSAAVDSAFNTLAQTVLVQNARTLEDLVREMLRPMLKSWLDDNLPGLVERLVRAEIERVSRGR
jgi:uncharacterized protein